MMSLGTIRTMNQEAAARAAEEGMTPYVYFDVTDVGEAVDGAIFPFPYIGDHRPEGWELVDEHFVDSSGFGREDEPALTVDSFIEVIRERIRASEKTFGWAIIESGQFQVYVGEFERTGS